MVILRWAVAFSPVPRELDESKGREDIVSTLAAIIALYSDIPQGLQTQMRVGSSGPRSHLSCWVTVG